MSFARNVATVGSATLLSRLTGFARDVGVAAVLGAGGGADAFFAAMLLPNLFRRLLSDGALNSAFVPLWLRRRQDGGEAGRCFTERVLGTVLLALGAAALAAIVFAPWFVAALAPGFAPGQDRLALAIVDLRLAIGYIAVSGVVAVAAARLNAEGRIAAPAFGLVSFNGVMLVAVLVLLLPGAAEKAPPGAFLAASVVAAGLAQLLIVGAALMRGADPPRRLRLGWTPDIGRFYARVLPGAIAVGIPQLTLIAGAMVASASPRAVSWLYYAYRLYELPLGIISALAAAVMVPSIAAGVRAGARRPVSETQSRSLEIAVGLALPAAAGLALLAKPIARVLFQHGAFNPSDTAAVAAAVSVVACGLPGHVIEKVFGAVCFAHEDTRTPMFAALAGLAIAALAALLLFPHFAHVGVAAGIALAGWIGSAILCLVLTRRGRLALDPTARRRLPRLVLATAAMTTVILVAERLMPVEHGNLGHAVALAGLIVLGLASYGAALATLGVIRLGALIAPLRSRA